MDRFQQAAERIARPIHDRADVRAIVEQTIRATVALVVEEVRALVGGQGGTAPYPDAYERAGSAPDAEPDPPSWVRDSRFLCGVIGCKESVIVGTAHCPEHATPSAAPSAAPPPDAPTATASAACAGCGAQPCGLWDPPYCCDACRKKSSLLSDAPAGLVAYLRHLTTCDADPDSECIWNNEHGPVPTAGCPEGVRLARTVSPLAAPRTEPPADEVARLRAEIERLQGALRAAADESAMVRGDLARMVRRCNDLEQERDRAIAAEREARAAVERARREATAAERLARAEAIEDAAQVVANHACGHASCDSVACGTARAFADEIRALAEPAPAAPDTFPRAPRDEAEREACEYHTRSRHIDDLCGAGPCNPDGSGYCSRKPGHDGAHVNAGSSTTVLARWPQPGTVGALPVGAAMEPGAIEVRASTTAREGSGE